MPIATSRCANFSLMKPMRMPAATVIATRPQSGAMADEHGARRAGEADMCQRMASKGLPAQHQEIADATGDDRDHRRRSEGVAHKSYSNMRMVFVGVAMRVVVLVPMVITLDIVGRPTSRRYDRGPG
ncbi:MAG: hypothetical protein WDN29_07125 [Methylovirgula sp.]